MSSDKYISRRIPLPDEYKDVFTHFYVAKNKGNVPITHHFVLSFQTIIAFGFGTPGVLSILGHQSIPIDGCILLGPIKQAFDYTLNAGSEILVANFKDDAFFRFFGNYQLEEMWIDPDQLFADESFASIHKSISALPAVEQKITAILAFARPYLMPRDEAFERIAKFSSENEILSPVKTISETHHVSERSVQLSHKKYLRYSSKEVARYNRFLKTIKLLRKNEAPIDWLEIVTICGYYDQSQLIKDFKYFLHLTPTQYLKFKDSLCFSDLD